MVIRMLDDQALLLAKLLRIPVEEIQRQLRAFQLNLFDLLLLLRRQLALINLLEQCGLDVAAVILVPKEIASVKIELPSRRVVTTSAVARIFRWWLSADCLISRIRHSSSTPKDSLRSSRSICRRS